MSVFSRFIARRRIWLFFAMLALVVAAGLLVPHITVNTDMTKYLPEDYPMKRGLNLVLQQRPGMEEQIKNLGAAFGNGNDLMPTDLPRALTIGVALVFLVLLIMCSSLMEVPLFLVTAVFAVALNMGTNALLPSVSIITNNLSPVLQMVLSMDYSIILMNRYRHERLLGTLPTEAMSASLAGATPSILSSAFTTIVSLLMLTFIKLKIGADLGFVLAKGVAFSLICNFTVLPALIVWADKSVIFKTKKTPRFPSGAVSRFQTRFKWTLTALFVAIVVAAFILQWRTPINFAPQWNSKASENARSDNPMLLVYETAEEAALPLLMQNLESDCNVLQTISYPTTLGRRCTAPEMAEMMAGYVQDTIPAELLQMVYYAIAHPERDGRLSFDEIEAATEDLAARGLMPEGINYERMMASVMPPVALPEPADDMPQVEQLSPQQEITPAPDSIAVMPADTACVAESPLVSEAVNGQETETAGENDAAALVHPVITYEELTRQLPAEDIAALSGADKSQIRIVFRLAGRAGKTMSPAEFYTFVRDNILTNKRYAAMVPEDMKQKFISFGGEIEAVLAAGPETALTEEPVLQAAAREEAMAAVPDTVALVLPRLPEVTAEITPPEPVQAPETELAPEPTALEKLIDMMVSGWRYSAGTVYSSLNAAGIAVSREDIDLLYLYALSRRDFDPEQTVTPEHLLYYIADTLMQMPGVKRLMPESALSAVDSARTIVSENAGLLRGEMYSFALVNTLYPAESDSTFAFVANVNAAADGLLRGTHYWIGEPEMYKELKDAFPRELMLLTILTVLAIYLIVALTFRSLLLPIPLVLSVLAGVHVNVIVSGLGGGTMYYLAYLIVQGILMGAAIDYSILFTSYFRSARRTSSVCDAIKTAFEGSSHSVLTSGLILTLVPMALHFSMSDPMIGGIVKSLSIGAFAAVIIIMLLLPATLAVLDPIINRKIRYNED